MQLHELDTLIAGASEPVILMEGRRSIPEENKGLIKQRTGAGRTAAKAAYLIRDTMKVTGFSEAFPRATVALFYVDESDPLAGGTGHTVRVCRNEGVPAVFQEDWGEW